MPDISSSAGKAPTSVEAMTKWAGPDRKSDGRFKYLGAAFVPHRNSVPALGKARTLGPDAMGNETGVLPGLLSGRAFVTHDVTSGRLTNEIKKEPLHSNRTRSSSSCSCSRKGRWKYVQRPAGLKIIRN
jgi:hypothetical protein